MMSPAVEKSLSEGVLIAGIHNTFFATAEIAGNLKWC